MDNFLQITLAVIGVLGSASVWRYFEAKLKSNIEEKRFELQNNEGVQYRNDLKTRVTNLEDLLENSGKEKDTLRQQVLDLVAEVHALRVEVDYLKKENQNLLRK
jgi:predicted nuclease with TOPRIM domain|tara:strand:- start:907 stop:1218 length:312 start_codon:yes stop_codon:yes gene_type:complete